MSYTIQLLPAARLDLKEIMAYYEEQQSGLAARFFKNLLPTMRRIRQNPALFQARHKKVRQAPVKKFPIWVHYIIVVLSLQSVLV